jgi:hypothetical protein
MIAFKIAILIYYYIVSNRLEQAPALPHQKCYRKETVPHFENVTQIIIRMPEGGHPNGVTHERETGGNEGI